MWEPVGSVDPRALVDARLQLHWAAQAAAGVGRTLHAKREDDSQSSFTWSPILDALVQEPFSGITVGLRPRDLTLLAIGKTASKLPLRGRTLDEAFAFVEAQFETTLVHPNVDDFPKHAVARGDAFDADASHLAELARSFNNAALLLGEIARADSRAGMVRCWPHHFDLATLITLSPHGEPLRTIGVGFSPGDAAIAEPYYYVTPWPYPDPARLRPLKRGRWNTDGWTGALLTASELAGSERAARMFLADAIACSREVL